MVNLGVIGKPSDWLISCDVDKNKLKEKLGIDLIDISSDELINLINSHQEEIPEDLIKVKYDKKELNKAYQIYLAINDLVKKYDLKGFTIRCFDLLDTVHSTSCLALALFNDHDIIGTCEGDVPALISMYLVTKILNKPSFQCNPSEIDAENSSMILAHCTLPLKMTSSYNLTTHYESKIGIGIKGEMILGDCLIFRISPDLDKFVLLEGTIIENLSRFNLCRTQIRVNVKENIDYFLKRPLGNHHLVIYGNDKDKLIEFLNKNSIRRIS